MTAYLLALLRPLIEQGLGSLAAAVGGGAIAWLVPLLEGIGTRLLQRWRENKVMVDAGAAQQRATTDKALADRADEARDLSDAIDRAGADAAHDDLAGWRRPG